MEEQGLLEGRIKGKGELKKEIEKGIRGKEKGKGGIVKYITTRGLQGGGQECSKSAQNL